MSKIDRVARILALANGGSGSGAGFKAEVVDVLPATGEIGVIYLVPKAKKNKNIYDEYMFINEQWELIGNTEVDLTDYATKTYVSNAIAGIPQGPQGEQGPTGESGVYMGPTAPTDPNQTVWIDTSDGVTVSNAEGSEF